MTQLDWGQIKLQICSLIGRLSPRSLFLTADSPRSRNTSKCRSEEQRGSDCLKMAIRGLSCSYVRFLEKWSFYLAFSSPDLAEYWFYRLAFRSRWCRGSCRVLCSNQSISHQACVTVLAASLLFPSVFSAPSNDALPCTEAEVVFRSEGYRWNEVDQSQDQRSDSTELTSCASFRGSPSNRWLSAQSSLVVPRAFPTTTLRYSYPWI